MVHMSFFFGQYMVHMYVCLSQHRKSSANYVSKNQTRTVLSNVHLTNYHLYMLIRLVWFMV